MSMTTDTERFFESDAAYEERQRRLAKKTGLLNNSNSNSDNGNLLVYTDPESKVMEALSLGAIGGAGESNCLIAIATAGGCISIVQLLSQEGGVKVKVVAEKKRAHSAPITSLAYCEQSRILYSGSWDKSIKAYSLLKDNDDAATDATKVLLDATVKITEAHGDFVKCLCVIPLSSSSSSSGSNTGASAALISGGADKIIRIWSDKGQCLQVLKGKHTRPVERIAILMHSAPTSIITFASAGSDMKIYLWQMTSSNASNIKVQCLMQLANHETSVYSLSPFSDDDDNVFLISGSADKTVQISSHMRQQVIIISVKRLI